MPSITVKAAVKHVRPEFFLLVDLGEFFVRFRVGGGGGGGGVSELFFFFYLYIFSAFFIFFLDISRNSKTIYR